MYYTDFLVDFCFRSNNLKWTSIFRIASTDTAPLPLTWSEKLLNTLSLLIIPHAKIPLKHIFS